MSVQGPVVYAVPTHLREREPFAFGRTVGEVAKIALAGWLAARLLGSDDLPGALRIPAAAIVLLLGTGWALVRIQRRPLDGWLGLAFLYGATPRRRVWRSGGVPLLGHATPGEVERERGWYELERVRVRWHTRDHGARSDPRQTAGTPGEFV
jgi:hypothetical protein